MSGRRMRVSSVSGPQTVFVSRRARDRDSRRKRTRLRTQSVISCDQEWAGRVHREGTSISAGSTPATSAMLARRWAKTKGAVPRWEGAT
jgi:hypothetical protein